jgi:hypothetical protein
VRNQNGTRSDERDEGWAGRYGTRTEHQLFATLSIRYIPTSYFEIIHQQAQEKAGLKGNVK